MKKTIHIIAGARPNFMKVAPIMRALAGKSSLDARLIHTGQHYDASMSDVFFKELGIPDPSVHLDVGSASHAVQTAKIMIAYEACCLEQRPDMVIVVGDVNSTVACSLVAKKLGIPVAHVEAGLRSRDMAMPEEINRLVTDAISDLCYVTEPDGEKNLLSEGKARDAVQFVGHVMIDNLFYQVQQLAKTESASFEYGGLKKRLGKYGVVTLHRPSNVDDEATLQRLLSALIEVSAEAPLIFAVHPRTRSRIDTFSIAIPESIVLTPPLPYMEFLNLWKDAAIVMTDSGGLQEETTALGVPCLTLRENTERPITLSMGTNVLVGTDRAKIVAAAFEILRGKARQGSRPPLWDGMAAERIAGHVESWLSRAR